MATMVRIAIVLSILMMIASVTVFTQSVDPPLIHRFDVLEEMVRALGKQVSELNTKLRAAVPPSPTQDVEPFDLVITGAAIGGAINAKGVFSRICGSLRAPVADPTYGTGRFPSIGTNETRRPFWWSVSLYC